MNRHLLRTCFHFAAAGFALLSAVAGAQSLVCTPFHAGGIYNLGKRAGWTVTLPPGQSAPPGAYTYTIRKNNFDTIKSGDLDFSSGAATIETRLDEPAMLYAEVKPPTGPAIHLGAAIAPAGFQPSVARPADFDSFWDDKLQYLAAIPINPSLAPTPANKEGVELYTVKLDSLGSHVQGYLARPANEGKFPALVIYQYAGDRKSVV